jgi:hypothetical protein
MAAFSLYNIVYRLFGEAFFETYPPIMKGYMVWPA